MHLRSISFVVSQFICLGYLALTGGMLPFNPILISIELLGVVLFVWTILKLRPGRFNAAPEVHPRGELATTGPYRYVRHPMYSAVLLITLIWVINLFSWPRLIVWLALLILLIVKLRYEEKFLAERFPDYPQYTQKTNMLIPWLL